MVVGAAVQVGNMTRPGDTGGRCDPRRGASERAISLPRFFVAAGTDGCSGSRMRSAPSHDRCTFNCGSKPPLSKCAISRAGFRLGSRHRQSLRLRQADHDADPTAAVGFERAAVNFHQLCRGGDQEHQARGTPRQRPAEGAGRACADGVPVTRRCLEARPALTLASDKRYSGRPSAGLTSWLSLTSSGTKCG
jgi:hypothetical protein